MIGFFLQCRFFTSFYKQKNSAFIEEKQECNIFKSPLKKSNNNKNLWVSPFYFYLTELGKTPKKSLNFLVK